MINQETIYINYINYINIINDNYYCYNYILYNNETHLAMNNDLNALPINITNSFNNSEQCNNYIMRHIDTMVDISQLGDGLNNSIALQIFNKMSIQLIDLVKQRRKFEELEQNSTSQPLLE